jgi:hypothetical protein
METTTWVIILVFILIIIVSIYYSVLTPLFFECPQDGSCPCRQAGRNCPWRCRYCNNYRMNCALTRYGCCPNGRTPRLNPIGSNCFPNPPRPMNCAGTRYGCCPDGKTVKKNYRGSNCWGIYL